VVVLRLEEIHQNEGVRARLSDRVVLANVKRQKIAPIVRAAVRSERTRTSTYQNKTSPEAGRDVVFRRGQIASRRRKLARELFGLLGKHEVGQEEIDCSVVAREGGHDGAPELHLILDVHSTQAEERGRNFICNSKPCAVFEFRVVRLKHGRKGGMKLNFRQAAVIVRKRGQSNGDIGMTELRPQTRNVLDGR
jgi:hypothetical protein